MYLEIVEEKQAEDGKAGPSRLRLQRRRSAPAAEGG
jgi:hypothetical protein